MKNAAELETIEKMLYIYCRGVHGPGPGLCPACRRLLGAAKEKLSRCPHAPKPPCRDCRTHCWPPGSREKIIEVMRYAGPRMPLRHPLLALRHFFRK